MGLSPLVVHIEALVLRGVRHEDRHAVSAGIQKELSRLLAQSGAGARLARLGDLHHVRAGQVAVADGSSPEQMGVAAAQRIVGGLLP